MSSIREVVRTLGLLGACALAGCGGDPAPKTYPVKGKVVQADGKPMTAGLIEFHSKADPSQTVNGDIQRDGTFTLHTRLDKRALTGAPEGQYTVVIVPSLEGDQTKQPDTRPIFLPNVLTVEARDGNDFPITLPPPARRP